MKQEHYGAIFMIALFAAALFIESLPAVSALCLAVMVFCLIKGQLWEIKEERSEENERHNAQNKRIYRYSEHKEHA